LAIGPLPLPNTCSLINSGLSLLPLSIPLDPETISDTIRAWVSLSRLAHLLCFLDDAAVVAAIELNDTAGGIDSTPASMLDRFNESLTHVSPEFCPCQLLRVYLAAILTGGRGSIECRTSYGRLGGRDLVFPYSLVVREQSSAEQRYLYLEFH
jgi:hypothetical protein